MNSRNRRIIRRAEALYAFFIIHAEEMFTLAEACAELGCSPGNTSRAAIGHVRKWAIADGWWFPPAVPATDMRYVLTKNPSKLIDPVLHMGRIVSGVQRTETELLDNIREHQDDLPAEDRPIASARLAVFDFQQEVLQSMDKVTRKLVDTRREERRKVSQ